ncbi:AAA family ATPase [Legionella sainthelensi]|uniref:AAA family ATPase n=1 Tax=Legionella sainthelensi TaxID=28087 RepID=UPI000E1FC3A2|nr:ATP-binding protein [Legionella sainthelensi]
MIINFSLENWMSFQNKVTFSMIATRERQHSERISKLRKYSIGILPIAAIYGGNAAGKTNFFKALNFAKNLIVKGTQPDSFIPVEVFRLNSEKVNNPSCFSFELLIDEIIYEFNFKLTKKLILEESLIKITSTSETLLYKRSYDKIKFHHTLDNDKFLKFAFKGTRENQLFLTNSISQKVENFKPVHNWFKNNLELIAPDSRFEPFEQFLDEENPLFATMNEILPLLDTGIAHIGGETVPVESLSIPDGLITKLKEDLKNGMTVKLSKPFKDRFIITRKDDELIAKKLVTYHPTSDGGKVKFEIYNESDGSQRIIELLPAFLELSAPKSNKVYIIDEVDRSLHPLLTKQLVENYLDSCSHETRSQLLFTTHNGLLMDQSIFRRDEMWVSERDTLGSSNIFSLSEYKDIRYDKDIRKSYFQGRLGGVPRIIANTFASNQEKNNKYERERCQKNVNLREK